MKNHIIEATLYISILFNSHTVCSEVPRPRGVPLSKAPLYDPSSSFKCFDGSKTIPFSQVNDDFCDCQDASDEPGTSACPHGYFYCVNAGYKPTNIGSNRVNDGICDCCDGSDEYATDAKCINDCVELGKTARKEEIEREELLKAGKQLREQFSQKGIQERQARKEKLVELEQNKAEAERIKLEKEQLKEEAESAENHALEYYRKLEEEKNKQKAELERLREETEAVNAFRKYDLDQNEKVNIQEIQQHVQTFDKDKDGQVSEEEARYFLDEHEEVGLEEFTKACWTKIKPYLIMESASYSKNDEEKEEEAEEDEETEPETETDQQVHEDESEHENTEEPEDIDEPAHPDLDSPIEYDEDTQQLVDTANEARKQFNEADSNLKSIQDEVDKIKEYLEMDLGADEEFAPLQGECFEYSDHEYIYKLCPFDKTIQKPKSGSMETRLGSWGKWNGPDNNKYESMLYDRGQACWNGPQRNTLVKIFCGNENKLISVTEPNKCEYVFEFVTPAACFDNSSNDIHKVHEEL